MTAEFRLSGITLEQVVQRNWWVPVVMATALDWSKVSANSSMVFLGCGAEAEELACMRFLLSETRRAGAIYGVDLLERSRLGDEIVALARSRTIKADYAATPGSIMKQIRRPIGAIFMRNPNVTVQNPGYSVSVRRPELVDAAVQWAKIARDFHTQFVVTTEHPETKELLSKALQAAGLNFRQTENRYFIDHPTPSDRKALVARPEIELAVRDNILPDQFVFVVA
ncbi:MAG: hypothetical protein WC775_00765 [Patescibacteria group bacterium]|jgi:hypothetical protein